MTQKIRQFDSRDTQVGGDHYRVSSLQPWDIMEDYFSPSEMQGFLWGNVLKYVLRFPRKNGLEDLKKAAHYLEKLIEHYEQHTSAKTKERIDGRATSTDL